MDRCPEDPNAHCRNSGVQPGRVDAVAIVEDEAIVVRSREDCPELRQGPRRRRVTSPLTGSSQRRASCITTITYNTRNRTVLTTQKSAASSTEA